MRERRVWLREERVGGWREGRVGGCEKGGWLVESGTRGGWSREVRGRCAGAGIEGGPGCTSRAELWLIDTGLGREVSQTNNSEYIPTNTARDSDAVMSPVETT